MLNPSSTAQAIHELLTAGLGGRISRREMLRRATSLHLSAPMIWLLLRAVPTANPPAVRDFGNNEPIDNRSYRET